MTTFPVEFWTDGKGFPGTTAPLAVQFEKEGWDGISVPDSQNLTGDPYIALAMAAAATSRIKLGTGVTNSLTRHPAVTATAIASLNEESGGRAVLGIGRGDSALAHLGFAPASVPSFIRYVERVQKYLNLEDVDFEFDLDGANNARPADSLKLADAPNQSRLRWLKYGKQSKVPLHVMATGPKVIASSAVVADGLIFAVGAGSTRVKWAVDTARNAREAAGLDPDTLLMGAMLPIAVHDDKTTAVNLVSPMIGSYVRFSVMHGTPTGPASDSERASLTKVHKSYDMNTHARRGPQTDYVTDELIEDFAVCGSSQYCIDRFGELRELGLTKFLLVRGESIDLKEDDGDAREVAYQNLVNDVLPGARA